MLRPGLSFRETMHGTLWRLDAPTDERAVDVELEMRARDLGTVAFDRTLKVDGTLHVERLADHVPCEGTVALRVRAGGRVPYRIRFRGDDGQDYELSGEKEWLPFAPVESITTLPASLYDARGREIARATLRFDLRHEWWHLLRSIRVHLLG